MFARFWLKTSFRRDAILVLTIGTLLSLMSPFGATNHLPLIGAWAYWTGLLAWGWIASRFIAPLLERNLPKLSHFWLNVLASLVMALFMFPAILLVQTATGYPIPVSFWPTLYFLIWVISASITGISFLAKKAYASKTPNDGSAFFARIPAKISDGSLYAISSEDHYLRIQTARGSDLILMRLADAICELGGYDGMQVHRSWWVARQGVERVKRDQGRIFLILRDQTQVPVSRTYAPKIRAAGWLG